MVPGFELSVLYADTSALIRAYFVDGEGHSVLRRLLLEGDEPVITSEIARVELASAVRGAERAGRVRTADGLLARIDADCAADGPVTLISLRSEPALRIARGLVDRHLLRALDAIHLAVALEDGRQLAGGERLEFVTCDERQRAAAGAAGLSVR